MYKRLIVLCFALVVAGFCVPAAASSAISYYEPLKVDIVYGPYDQQPKSGWMPWSFPFELTGPVSKEFVIPGVLPGELFPVAQLEAYRKNETPEIIARDRSGGFAGVNRTGDISPTEMGFGMNYLKLTISNLDPYTDYKFSLWSFEKREVWSADPLNPDSKYGCWSTTNPKDWLVENGYSGFTGEPNGYGPITPVPNPPTGDSNMPSGLADLVLAQGGRTFMMAPTDDNYNYVGGPNYRVSFYASSDGSGAIAVYGWLDCTDWAGAMHMPLNGFEVIPEPATIALLGLGVLPLLRKRGK